MGKSIKVGIIGDRDPNKATHAATEEALGHAADAGGVSVVAEWLPTAGLQAEAGTLAGFDAFWCAPGSPYKSLDGALRAVRFARESGVPFVGTCGGFQHAVIEYARNMLGRTDAGHAEYDPLSPDPFVSALSCSPFGRTMRVELEAGSKVHGIYGAAVAEEEYRCNYGLAPENRRLLEEGGLRVSGTDPEGEARIVELPGHPFYVATLFVPQMGSRPGGPHPLISAFLKAGFGAKDRGEIREQTS